ncbi:MAG: hypothetical protein ACXV9Q_05665, partial [Chthoniobacterales bacterium]
GKAAHQLAAKILSDPIFSDSTRTEKDRARARESAPAAKSDAWHFMETSGASKLASAIRPEEVYAALKRLAKKGDENAANILDALFDPQQQQEVIAQKLQPFREIAEELPDGPTKAKLVDLVENMPANYLADVDAARAKFDSWFGSAMDRAQQWFQLHTRGLTIAMSVLVALFLQLDAVEIFHFVSTNAAGRAALVGSTDKLLKETETVSDDKGGLIARIAASFAARTKRPIPDLTGITNTAQLRELLASDKKTQQDFDAAAADATRAYFQERRDKLADLTRDVSATGFEFIPVNYWRWPSEKGDAGESVAHIVPHLPGIALFAALLTLGAPYWFNLLKNLANLRPALARSISQEEDKNSEEKK